MAYTKLKIYGALEGFVPHFFDPPTFKGDPTDFRIRVRVAEEDSEELRNLLFEAYEGCCNWYTKQTNSRRFFDQPWIENEDGSITVRLTAKPRYEEHPFPVVDGDLEPLDEDLSLREGTTVLVSTVLMPYSPKSPSGGMRIKPRAVQIISAVTGAAKDSGELNLEKEFSKTEGFKQNKPKVQKKTTKKSDNVSDEEDF